MGLLNFRFQRTQKEILHISCGPLAGIRIWKQENGYCLNQPRLHCQCGKYQSRSLALRTLSVNIELKPFSLVAPRVFPHKTRNFWKLRNSSRHYLILASTFRVTSQFWFQIYLSCFIYVHFYVFLPTEVNSLTFICALQKTFKGHSGRSHARCPCRSHLPRSLIFYE